MTDREGQLSSHHLRQQATILRAATAWAEPAVANALAEKAAAYDATAKFIEGVVAPEGGA